jgi:hypothetical protein
MLLMNLFDQLNAHRYLYLDKLYEENDLELCVVVNEAKVQGDELQRADNASAYGAIVADDTCKRYKVTFRNYVAYSVTNESFTVLDDEERFTGNLFRQFSKSKFLDYVAASTVAVEDIVGPYTHYEIACLNQIIDVATGREPTIETIASFGTAT